MSLALKSWIRNIYATIFKIWNELYGRFSLLTIYSSSCIMCIYVLHISQPQKGCACGDGDNDDSMKILFQVFGSTKIYRRLVCVRLSYVPICIRIVLVALILHRPAASQLNNITMVVVLYVQCGTVTVSIPIYI